MEKTFTFWAEKTFSCRWIGVFLIEKILVCLLFYSHPSYWCAIYTLPKKTNNQIFLVHFEPVVFSILIVFFALFNSNIICCSTVFVNRRKLRNCGRYVANLKMSELFTDMMLIEINIILLQIWRHWIGCEQSRRSKRGGRAWQNSPSAARPPDNIKAPPPWARCIERSTSTYRFVDILGFSPTAYFFSDPRYIWLAETRIFKKILP